MDNLFCCSSWLEKESLWLNISLANKNRPTTYLQQEMDNMGGQAPTTSCCDVSELRVGQLYYIQTHLY